MLGEQYIRESDGKAFLLLKKGKHTFEEQMIRNGTPKGVLPMGKAETEDLYKYEITGRKTLATTFERIPMNAEQIKTILSGMLEIMERGREYLLSEDNFILQPEHIYLRIPDYEVTLCYYPDYDVPFAEQMGKLFELLLNRVDYREEAAIAMVYALYMQLQEPDMTLERIRKKLQEQVAAAPAEWSYGPVEEKKEAPVKEKGMQSYGQPEMPRKKKAGLWGRLCKEVGERLVQGGDRKPADMSLPVSTSMSMQPISCVRETAPEWGAQYTKVLSVKREEGSPCIVSGENGETISLTKFPFYVGSLPDYMDYVIEQDTVSRFHAKFIKQGDKVLLVDLNSTNGTRVNGYSLTAQEQVKLSTGDRIAFADREYTFVGEKA